MMGTAVDLGRRQGGSRFYDAGRARRGHHHGLPKSRCAAAAVTQEKAPEESSRLPASPVGVAGNLKRFVAAVTLSVPAEYPSERGEWRGCGVDANRERPYFVLDDLWEAYKEWSAYGAGVPLVLDGCDGVVQYYVPYLSAIELYGDSSVLQSSSNPRLHMMDDSDEDFHDSSSDGSSDYEHVRVKHFAQEGFSRDVGESGVTHGRLLFQYLEFDSPFCREPLTDKISSLSARFPGLRTLRSCDLSARSWMSIAWYPIYRIPTGPTLKDLDACFLTFHQLSNCPQGDNLWAPDSTPNIPLPVFGLASYKFSNSVWSSTDGDWKLASCLRQAAADWLRDSRAGHPDYQFFVSHGAYNR
ncbi:hypothetical protein CFC21_041226 [Triticum aestivum]|uniref:Uncharacterized protein n=3 Tax=Triticum TaxID=4564 RepID=A0A9R1QG19_TRITD|nr:hypothetical protein CFC21_041226 [Triticum aestivum]VAH76628.1 unnamed protein product [Triticum turgidum subsp. durum]